jgi:hypothetical protein
MKTDSLHESARLELAGSEHRLEAALRSLRNFQREHGELDDVGFAFRAGIDRALLPSLQRELQAHEVELDEAMRAVRHAKALLAEVPATA